LYRQVRWQIKAVLKDGILESLTEDSIEGVGLPQREPENLLTSVADEEAGEC
jgi:hypothetical protein